MVPYHSTRILRPISSAAEAALASRQRDPRERVKTYQVTSAMLVLVQSAVKACTLLQVSPTTRIQAALM